MPRAGGRGVATTPPQMRAGGLSRVPFPPVSRARGRRVSCVRATKGRDAPPLVPPEEVWQHVWESVDLWSTSIHARVRCGCDNGAAREPAFTLAYMPMRNRCEVSRLMLEATETPYDFEVVGFMAWADLKSGTPFGRLPVLRNFDGEGEDLAQETAIMRFLARRLGLTGANDLEEAAADSLFQHYWCTLRNNGLSHDGEHYSADALRELADAQPADGGCHPRTYRDMRRVNDWAVSERSLAALRVFEEQLAATGTGYLVGAGLTYVDLALFGILFELAEDDTVPDYAARFALPLLGQFQERVQALPGVERYLSSKARMPRYLRPGYKYKPGRGSPSPMLS